MAVVSYLCYVFHCEIDGQPNQYVGTAGVLANQSPYSTMHWRSQWHQLKPVRCLQGHDPDSAHMELIKSGLTQREAFELEAYETACRHVKNGSDVRVRGACWHGKGLSGSEKEVMKQVSSLRSHKLLRFVQLPEESLLQKHLLGESYSAVAARPVPSSWSRLPVTMPPLAIMKPSRSGTRTCGWYAWKAGCKPGHWRWPSNWEAIPLWRARNGR